MRIAIDFQGAQTGSRFRGIGRYVTALVKALIAEGRDHEFVLLLNGAFPESIEGIRADFAGLLPPERIVVWHPVGEPEAFDQPGQNLRTASQIIREFALKTLDADVILISSLFEGLGNPAVISVNEYLRDTPTAAIFYDLTPLLVPSKEFQSNLFYRAWYRHRMEQLKRCDLVFTISESSRRELHHFLDFPEDRSVNIFGGRTRKFTVRDYDAQERAAKLKKMGISRPFILYTGGLEANKNLHRLIESLSLLPEEIQKSHELVIAGKRNAGEEQEIRSLAKDRLSRDMLNVVGYVSEDELIDLYNLCDLFVCPSLREGFGLPVAEAMACGAPVVLSNRSSLPELMDKPEAQFDPEFPEEIAATVGAVLTDKDLSASLVEYGRARAEGLTWENSARTLLSSLEQQIKPRRKFDLARKNNIVKTGRFTSKPPRIMVMKLDHNGDFLLGVPAMMKLRARYPDARIDIVVGSWNYEAANALGIFANIYTLDYFKARSSDPAGLDAGAMSDLLSKVPYYDFAIDLRRQSESRFLLVQIPASQYFGYDTGERDIDQLMTKTLPRFPEPGGHFTYFDSQHTADQLLKIVDLLPYASRDYLSLPEKQSTPAARGGSVAIFPLVGNPSRQWDDERFGDLINRLAANDEVTKINLYAGREAELNAIPFERNAKIALHAGYPYPKLLESLAGNAVCVGNNSFGVHLGSFAGCRTIGIYSGHERPEQWAPPFGDSWVITADVPCSPCHLPDRQSCPYDLLCLRDISVGTVEQVVLSALDDDGLHEEHAKISPSNPASAVLPLLRVLATARFNGEVGDFDDEQKTALAGALSLNFPEKPSSAHTVYVDVAGLETNEGMPGRTAENLDALQALAAALAGKGAKRRDVVWVAAGIHDHEMYAVETEELGHLGRILLSSDRRNRVVRPTAGDIFISPHVALRRNPALWNLLASWRLDGVRVVLAAPDPSAIETEAMRPDGAAPYLFKAAHFDALIVEPDLREDVEEWLREFAPPRLLPLQLIDGPANKILAENPVFIESVINPNARASARIIKEVA